MGGGRAIDIHYLTQAWVEGTGDATEPNDGATWNTYNGSDNWSTAGGSYNATATDSITVKAKAQWYTWTVTSDVQDFVDETTTNNGWILKDNDETVAQIKFAEYDSRTSGSNVPYLQVTFTAPWDSHTDSGRADPAEETFAAPDYTVYMKGTGFTSGNYDVGYYDATMTGGGNLVTTDTNISVSGDGILNSQYLLITDFNAVAGTWHVLVQPSSGYTSFDSAYDTTVGAPDTYGLLANDSFTVEQTAIPEFPTVISGVLVAPLCFGVYYWMRKRL